MPIYGKKPFVLVTSSITISADDCGTIYSLVSQSNSPGHYTCSLPTPTASLAGCTYTFVVGGDDGGLKLPIMLSASGDPIATSCVGAGCVPTGSFVGQIWGGAGGPESVYIDPNSAPYGYNLLKFRAEADGLGCFFGDRLDVTCQTFREFDGSSTDLASFWVVQGWTNTTASISGTNNPNAPW